jgi:hypothetical protein
VPPVTDEGLKITDGSVVLLKAAAKGVQMYTCKESAWDGGHAEPDALLSNEAGEIIIHHYLNFDPAGPAWEAKDGSKVVGKRLDPAQAKAGTIPWLKLQAVAHEGSGTLSKVTFIQRVDTEGGVAPGGACEANARVRVPYKATYYFYGPAN